MAYELNITFNDLMNIYSKNHKIGNRYDLKRAYEYAAGKHAGVVRGTGEPYIFHALRVAKLVCEWGLESDAIISALLHDVVEDCDTPLSEIRDIFGTNIAAIVDAVTALSDREFSDHTLTKAQKDLLSDAKLQRKMNDKALYVKIADRIDNLSTLSGVKEEKRIPKAEHTREIIIPMAMLENAYRFVDILEELCFRTEHPAMYEAVSSGYRNLRSINSSACHEALDTLSEAFDPLDPRSLSKEDELAPWHRYVAGFVHQRRSCISIFREISRRAENIVSDREALLSSDHIALYDMTLIVSDELDALGSITHPNDVFLAYFDKVLAGKGFRLIKYRQTTYRNAGYFLLADKTGIRYRLFVNTEMQYQRYLYGNIVDMDSSFSLRDINEIEPRDTYNEKIKVFRKDGSAMLIDKGATVLDFAFYIHSELGYHFAYAMVDESRTQLPAYTRLNAGDRITIVTREDISPDITWFKYVKTSKAVHHLVRYFQGRIN